MYGYTLWERIVLWSHQSAQTARTVYIIITWSISEWITEKGGCTGGERISEITGRFWNQKDTRVVLMLYISTRLFDENNHKSQIYNFVKLCECNIYHCLGLIIYYFMTHWKETEQGKLRDSSLIAFYIHLNFLRWMHMWSCVQKTFW